MTQYDGSPQQGVGIPRLDLEIAACQPWSGIVRRGETLRLIDTYGQQAIDTLFYHAADYAERYSARTRCAAKARPMSPSGRG